ncbi:MAG TPA: Mur ligase domain-containing protein [Victivallales bacterium]|nr:Mur ligase domain-containing protein [Victivallales bacterium]
MKKSKVLPIDTSLHFIGAGGAGMAPMALIMKEKGYKVSGSDLADSGNLRLLADNGVKIFCGNHNLKNLPNDKNAIIVASSAISQENPELSTALERGLKIFRRGEFLAKIAESYDKSVAVGGSHGKTTITAMITYCLKELGFSPGFMIGGKMKGLKHSGAAGDGTIFVTESDESDGTNAMISPYIAVVSNIDDDHAWNFSGEEELFANFAKFAFNSQKLVYGKSEKADKIFLKHNSKTALEISNTTRLPQAFSEWAPFQKLNALMAVHAVNLLSGTDLEKALLALINFPGVERRFSLRFKNEKLQIIEDYAHHPTELSSLMDSLDKIRKNRRLHIVFQPHRYARLKKYFDRFICELRRADKVTVLPVFSAWTPGNDIKSENLVSELNKNAGNNDFANFADQDFKSLSKKLLADDKEPELLVIVGAGDCDKLVENLLKTV